jgi:hypothetical protein
MNPAQALRRKDGVTIVKLFHLTARASNVVWLHTRNQRITIVPLNTVNRCSPLILEEQPQVGTSNRRYASFTLMTESGLLFTAQGIKHLMR